MADSAQTRTDAAKPPLDTRYDRRLAQILQFATEVFADKGYEGASMRDLSRLSGISLAGLYYYFDSKEELLYFIQRHTFTTIMERLRERIAGRKDPEQRVRIFIQNHVEYSLEQQKAMKLLAHEDEALKNDRGTELAAIKREYYRACFELVSELLKSDPARHPASHSAETAVNARTAVVSLFGMLNWIHTWYNPRVDPDATTLSRQMADLFLHGVRSGRAIGARTKVTSVAKSPAARGVRD